MLRLRTTAVCSGLLLLLTLAGGLSGCYRTETTRTSAMGGRPLQNGKKYDETPQNRGPLYVPNTKSRVW